MALTKIKGENFRAFVEDLHSGSVAAVTQASSCQVSITGNMESTKTKDSEGSYEQEQMTSRGWSIQVDDYDATSQKLIALLTQFNSDTQLSVGFDQTATTAGTMNQTPVNAAFARSGKAIITDFTIQANNRTNITVSRTLTGCGALS